MGDQISWTEDCEQCGGEQTVDCYDASSSLLWSRHCEKCGWNDPRGYYESDANNIELITEKEARARGIIMDCPECKKSMTWWERDNYGICISCEQDAKRRENTEMEQTFVIEIEKRIKKLGLQTTQCKSCGKEIMFLTTKNGKTMPVTMSLLSHFADCSQADKFRKKL